MVKVINGLKMRKSKVFDKLWTVIKDNNGNMAYFGLLMKRKENKIFVGTYQFIINF